MARAPEAPQPPGRREPAPDSDPAHDEVAARTDTTQHGSPRIWRAGRTAWAFVGILVALAALGFVLSELSLIVVPLILALFPATLLVPVARWLGKRGLPDALAALVSILAGIVLIGGLIGAMVPLVIIEWPELTESASDGIAQIEEFLDDEPFGMDVGGIDGLLEMAREQLGELGDLAPQAATAAFAAFEVLAGLLLLVVALFFYLKDGTRLADAIVTTLPERSRARARKLMGGSWETLGKYFRGQLLVALVDAVFIGIGLLILGVPLAVPLAVLIFFGGLFPIVGAVATGSLAVLVALADGGLVTGLIVLGIVIGVQQLEGNVLEPIILGRAISVHPLLVILAITAGSLTVGILGAFLAVPVAAIAGRVIDELRGRQPEEAETDGAEVAETKPDGADASG